jgi:hypothetical protein
VQPFSGQRVAPGVLQLVELEHRQQLDAVDAKCLQVWDLLPDSGICARELDAGRGAAREAANVHLVDDQVLDRQFERSIAFPIEVFCDGPGAIGTRA